MTSENGWVLCILPQARVVHWIRKTLAVNYDKVVTNYSCKSNVDWEYMSSLRFVNNVVCMTDDILWCNKNC